MQNVTDFEQKEHIVHEAREYAESIVDTVREPLIVLDADLKVVSANPSFYQTFKTKPEETQGQLIYNIGIQQWDIPKLRELLEKILPNNSSFKNYEVEHDFPHIGKRIMLLNARRIPQPPEKPRIILLAIEDITERQKAEQMVNKAREYAESIVDTVREPLIVLDADLKVVSANPSFYQTFKTKPEETQGQLIYDIGIQQWDIPKLRELLEKILPNNSSFENYEVEHDFPHIGKRIMLLNARRIPQPPEKPRIILLAIEDITEREKGEMLQETNQYLENLLNFTNAPIVVWNRDFKIIRFNNAFEHLTGYTSKWMIGKKLEILFPDENKVESLQKIQKTLSGEYWKSVEISILCKDKNIRIALWNSANIYDTIGKNLIATIAQGIDITERKQMEYELSEAYQKIETRTKELEMINENLDSFAYSVSHDLRAPLRAVSGFVQVLIDRHGDKINEEMRHYLNRISEGAQKMNQLIEDLLSFSRATRGEIKYEKINVQDIVNDLIKAYRDVEQDRDIEFIVNPLGEVEADKGMLKVVFSNLLQNAVKFTIDCKKACIVIGSEQKEDHIQFYVKDNGIGFDMRYKDKLFKAFQKLQTDERFAGTGLGLSTVKRIVTKHGGNIWAKGEIDKGAEFCFTLPFPKRCVED